MILDQIKAPKEIKEEIFKIISQKHLKNFHFENNKNEID